MAQYNPCEHCEYGHVPCDEHQGEDNLPCVLLHAAEQRVRKLEAERDGEHRERLHAEALLMDAWGLPKRHPGSQREVYPRGDPNGPIDPEPPEYDPNDEEAS